MRCPKCGYISFDHNQICPKCNKDISDEQAKLNLPTYKSNPPALLGMLVGAGDESNVGFTLDSDAALRSSGMGLDFEEASSMMESNSIGFGEDDQDLEISLTDDTGEFELPEVDLDGQPGDMSDAYSGAEDEELSLDMDEVSFEDSDDTADDLALDLGEVSMEEDGVADSLDGISPDDSLVLDGVSPDESAEETMELGAIPGEEVSLEDEGKSTIELNVSDLKINETGELEINSIPDEIYSPSSLPEEDEVDIDIDSEEGLELEAVSEEQTDDKNETGSLELSDISIDGSDDFAVDEMGGSDTAELQAQSGEDDSLDLGDLALGESEESGDEGISETIDMGAVSADEEDFDLGDLAFEDDSEEGESFDLSDLNLDNKETGELRLSDFEVNEAKEEPPAGSEETVAFDDSLTIDLENLDLDLDLDDSDDKK